MNTLPPYIGITDFTSIEQVRAMGKVFQEHLPAGSKRQLHIGVMISHKTLNDIKTIWSKAFPPKEEIADIFAVEGVYNCLHYADYVPRESFYSDLVRATNYGGTGIHAVQLDMTWPDPTQVAIARHAFHRSIEIVLQIGKSAFEKADNNPIKVVQKLEKYRIVIDRVLLDKSVGRGLSMNAIELIPFLRAIKGQFPNIGLGVAGGLGPNSTDLVQPLLEEFPDISIDAQGKLRPSGNALDPVDWKMAETYLIGSLRLLR